MIAIFKQSAIMLKSSQFISFYKQSFPGEAAALWAGIISFDKLLLGQLRMFLDELQGFPEVQMQDLLELISHRNISIFPFLLRLDSVLWFLGLLGLNNWLLFGLLNDFNLNFFLNLLFLLGSPLLAAFPTLSTFSLLFLATFSSRDE
jgi:hypothetical protein